MSFQSKISKNPHHLLEARNQPLQLSQPRQNAAAQCLVKTNSRLYLCRMSQVSGIHLHVLYVLLRSKPIQQWQKEQMYRQMNEFHSGNRNTFDLASSVQVCDALMLAKLSVVEIMYSTSWFNSSWTKDRQLDDRLDLTWLFCTKVEFWGTLLDYFHFPLPTQSTRICC